MTLNLSFDEEVSLVLHYFVRWSSPARVVASIRERTDGHSGFISCCSLAGQCAFLRLFGLEAMGRGHNPDTVILVPSTWAL